MRKNLKRTQNLEFIHKFSNKKSTDLGIIWLKSYQAKKKDAVNFYFSVKRMMFANERNTKLVCFGRPKTCCKNFYGEHKSTRQVQFL